MIRDLFCRHTGRYAVSIRYLPKSVTHSREYLPVARRLRRYRRGGRYDGKKCPRKLFCHHTGRYAVSIRYLPKIVTHPKEPLQVVRLLRRYRLGGRYDGMKCHPGSLLLSYRKIRSSYPVSPQNCYSSKRTFTGSQVVQEIPARGPV